MYLHIGQNEILPDRRVIGIFDLDKCSYGKRTREYLAAAAEKFKGKDRSAGVEPCTGGRSAADHTGVKYSHNHKIV